MALTTVLRTNVLHCDKAAITHRWKNHFEQLLNHLSVPCPDLPSTVQEDQQVCREPSELEVHTAVRKLKNGKAPGLCGITAEMLKASGDLGILCDQAGMADRSNST